MTETIHNEQRERLRSIDALRGLVMVLMALDHVRWFLSEDRFDPTDMTQTNAALFFTRWITHFCAPVFVFLAGTSAYLYGRRHGSHRVRRFLWTRGLWLILLELTVVRFGWLFNVDYSLLFLGVIWMIGACMLLTTPVITLHPRVLATLGALIVAGHGLLEPIEPGVFGTHGWLWQILHEGGRFELGGDAKAQVLFSIVPWIGVMWLGVAFGRMLEWPARRRTRALFTLGAGLCASFLLLRLPALYGNPEGWEPQGTWWMTLASILNTDKYPASLQFLLMTLGPSLLILPMLGSAARGVSWLVVIGRAPLFFYLLHLPLIHGIAALASLARHGEVIPWLRSNWGLARPPVDYGYDLLVIYLIWGTVIAALYLPCAAFAQLKRRSRSKLLSYL